MTRKIRKKTGRGEDPSRSPSADPVCEQLAAMAERLKQIQRDQVESLERLERLSERVAVLNERLDRLEVAGHLRKQGGLLGQVKRAIRRSLDDGGGTNGSVAVVPGGPAREERF